MFPYVLICDRNRLIHCVETAGVIRTLMTASALTVSDASSRCMTATVCAFAILRGPQRRGCAESPPKSCLFAWLSFVPRFADPIHNDCT